VRGNRGGSHDPGLLVVEADDSGGGLDRHTEAGRRRPKPWWLAVAVAAALVVAAALSRRDVDTATPTAEPTTVVAPPRPRTPPSSSETPVVASGLVAFVVSMLPDAPGLSSVDLDSGVVRPLMPGAVSFPSSGAVATMGDVAVVLSDDGFVAIHPDGRLQQFGAVPPLDGGVAVAAYDAGRVDAVWQVSGDTGQMRAVLVTDAGTVARRVVLPEGAVALAGDGVGGLLVVSLDQHLWRVPPDRDGVERLDTSLPLAVSGSGHLAAVRCDDRFVCGVEIVDLTTGDRHLIPGSVQPGTFAALSPDGSRLAQVLQASDTAGPPTMIAVVDTSSGAELSRQPYPSSPSGPLRWSPDGGWLVWSDDRGLEVWNVSDNSAPRSVAVPAGGDALAVLAVVARSA